jgi:hypothetical protein
LQLTLQNPASGVLGIANAVPTTLIPTGSLITLAGAIGATGAPGVSGGAPVGASYICRTADGTLTNETALDSLAAGYVKTQGSSGFGAVSTVATIPIADVTGTVPIAQGGTNLTTAPANKILVGDGAAYLQKEIVGTSPIVVTNSAGNITLSAPSIVPFSYVTFTRRVTGLGAANAPNVSPTSGSNPYSTSVYTTASYVGLDSASGFTASSGRFTVPYIGYYRIDAYFNLDAVSTTATVTVFLRKNGSDILVSKSFNVTNNGYHPLSLTYIDQATALTDFYEVLVSTDHNLYVDQGSSFSVQRIQA